MKHLTHFSKAASLRVFRASLFFCLGFIFVANAQAQQAPDIIWKTNAHRATVTSVKFIPAGTMLVSSANESSGDPAKLWRTTDTVLVRSFSIVHDNVIAVGFSPDGNLLFGGGGDGRMRIWQVSNGQILWTGGGPNDGFGGAAFSPDGSLLALGREDTWATMVNLINSLPDGNGARLFGAHTDMVSSVAFSPDGSLLASGSYDTTAILWRVSDGTPLRTLPHGYQIKAVQFSPDGHLLASGALDGTTRLWNLTNETDIRVLPAGDTLSLDFSPDGKLLLTASAGILKFWRVDDGRLVTSFDGETQGAVTAVDISPDGKNFAYGRGDGALVLARMPLWVETITHTSGQITLQWQGGSGLYQLQQRTNLTQGTWQNLGSPTAATSSTNATGADSLFYRVQSLPNP